MRPRGFTLIELLVALFITAVMMALGYAAVNQAASGRVAVEQQAARIVKVQRAVHALEQDIGLLQPRPVRDPLGGQDVAALVAHVSSQSSLGGATAATSSAPAATTASSLALQSTALLSLTRGGWANPVGIPRPEEQRVSYQVEDNVLVRYHQPVLDAVGETSLVRRELLDQVVSLNFRYMDAAHVWQDNWQVNGAPQQAQRHRPVAIEITLVLKDFGKLVRIVEIGG